jgi:hypothetical protein
VRVGLAERLGLQIGEEELGGRLRTAPARPKVTARQEIRAMAKGCACGLQHRRQRHPLQRPSSSRAFLLVDQRLVDNATEARVVSCKGNKYLRANRIGLVVHG